MTGEQESNASLGSSWASGEKPALSVLISMHMDSF